MSEVEIEYCTVCNYLPQALETADAVLRRHQRHLDGVHLVTGRDGVFRVRVDGETVWDGPIQDLEPREVEKRIAERIPHTKTA